MKKVLLLMLLFSFGISNAITIEGMPTQVKKEEKKEIKKEPKQKENKKTEEKVNVPPPPPKEVCKVIFYIKDSYGAYLKKAKLCTKGDKKYIVIYTINRVIKEDISE